MERLLARLDRRIGKFAIPNLTNFIVGGMAIAFVLIKLRPEFASVLSLDLDAVKSGQVWRLVSFLFIPTSLSIFWIFFALSFTLFVGRSLDAEWGAFKFNVYYFVGMLGTTAGALIAGHGVGNEWLNLSLLFALATMFPNTEIMLFIIPLKVKWLGLFSLVLMLYSSVEGSWADRIAIVCAMSNYFLFFTGHWVTKLRERNQGVRQKARRTSMSPEPDAPARALGRACAICGARQEDGADIRVCSCEKCGRARNLCLVHARDH